MKETETGGTCSTLERDEKFKIQIIEHCSTGICIDKSVISNFIIRYNLF
jgi:hypothetical protein